ncbi:MAG: glycosyltransferase [Candidatus Dojkabacteria bacterium]|nr:MAG: glycosyltransferase [Candidatus Dojkabacteria bacterium]
MNIIIDTTPTQSKPYSGIGIATKKITEQLVRNNPKVTYHLILHTDAESTLDPAVKNADNVILYDAGVLFPGYLNPLTYTLHLKPVIEYIYREIPESVYFATYFWQGHPAGYHPTAVMIYDFAMPMLDMYANKGVIVNALRKREYWFWQNRTARADAIIAISESTARDFLKCYKDYPEERVYKAFMGVELEKMSAEARAESGSPESEAKILAKYLPKDWKKKKYLIYMGGNIQRTKNNEGVVYSYQEMLKKLSSDGVSKAEAPYLVIAGAAYEIDSAPVKDFKQMIKDIGLKDKVVFSGFYEPEHKELLLKNAFAFTHLSHYEGFGLAVAEAMRAGTPVVVSETSSHPEVVGDAGMLVDGKDYKKVGEAYVTPV